MDEENPGGRAAEVMHQANAESRNTKKELVGTIKKVLIALIALTFFVGIVVIIYDILDVIEEPGEEVATAAQQVQPTRPIYCGTSVKRTISSASWSEPIHGEILRGVACETHWVRIGKSQSVLQMRINGDESTVKSWTFEKGPNYDVDENIDYSQFRLDNAGAEPVEIEVWFVLPR